jgi:hypothetical protein
VPTRPAGEIPETARNGRLWNTTRLAFRQLHSLTRCLVAGAVLSRLGAVRVRAVAQRARRGCITRAAGRRDDCTPFSDGGVGSLTRPFRDARRFPSPPIVARSHVHFEGPYLICVSASVLSCTLHHLEMIACPASKALTAAMCICLGRLSCTLHRLALQGDWPAAVRCQLAALLPTSVPCTPSQRAALQAAVLALLPSHVLRAPGPVARADALRHVARFWRRVGGNAASLEALLLKVCAPFPLPASRGSLLAPGGRQRGVAGGAAAQGVCTLPSYTQPANPIAL